jgi:thioredoxin-like negative regulator of GroEL
MASLLTRALALGILVLLFYGWYMHMRTAVHTTASAQKHSVTSSDVASSNKTPDASALAPLTLLDVPTFTAAMEASHTQPVWWMVYASWCPHCKRMLADLNALQKQHGSNIRIITVSIDNRPEQATAFVQSIDPLYVEAYLVGDRETYRFIGERFRALGLHYKGGSGEKGGISVPYNTVIWKGKPVAELNGALPTEHLASMVGDIVQNAK